MLRLVRWHRRMGLVLAGFLVMLASTGILINHSDQLDLDQPVKSPMVLSWYGIHTPDQISGFHTSLGWFSQLGSGIYWQQKRVAQCDENSLVGVLVLSEQFIVACEQLLFVLDSNGEIEEKLDTLFGLPVPINGLTQTADGQPLVRVGSNQPNTQQNNQDSEKLYSFDLESAQWAIVTSNVVAASELINELTDRATPLYAWPVLASVPLELKNSLLKNYQGTDIRWERVLLDLHSGRLLGTIGNLAMDVVAILILILAGSGLRLWWARPARK